MNPHRRCSERHSEMAAVLSELSSERHQVAALVRDLIGTNFPGLFEA
jgi:hypothetical protein